MTGRACVYRIFDADDVCLYVGSTVDLDVRLAFHALHQPWGHRIARHDVYWFNDETTARRAERHLIAAWRPRYNINGRGARGDWSQCDYAEYLDAKVHFARQGANRADRNALHERHLQVVSDEFARRYPDTAAVVLPTLFAVRAAA